MKNTIKTWLENNHNIDITSKEMLSGTKIGNIAWKFINTYCEHRLWSKCHRQLMNYLRLHCKKTTTGISHATRHLYEAGSVATYIDKWYTEQYPKIQGKV